MKTIILTGRCCILNQLSEEDFFKVKPLTFDAFICNPGLPSVSTWQKLKLNSKLMSHERNQKIKLFFQAALRKIEINRKFVQSEFISFCRELLDTHHAADIIFFHQGHGFKRISVKVEILLLHLRKKHLCKYPPFHLKVQYKAPFLHLVFYWW